MLWNKKVIELLRQQRGNVKLHGITGKLDSRPVETMLERHREYAKPVYPVVT